MKKFYNRDKEIAALLDIFAESKQQARFTYLLGQRRVGKTSLVNHVFLKKTQIISNSSATSNKVLYFFVERKSVEALLFEFTQILQATFELTPNFKDLSSFFKYLFEQATHQHLTVIFDEFQNFNYVDGSIFSSLQKLWDQYKQQSLLNLIVIGSIYSSMEKIFANQHEPLWGRPTDKLVLKSFDLATLWEILTDHKANTFDNLLNRYALFNGIPKYWDILEYRNLLSAKPSRVLEDLFLSPRSLLLNEGKELLMEEFGPEYQTYFSIIEAVATLSNVSTQKIAARTGVKSQHVHTYLTALNKKFDLITHRVSILNPSNKKARYVLKNRFLQTWFRYIFAQKSLIESSNFEVILEKFKQNFSSYKGMAFEELVLELLKKNYQLFPYEGWGQYWDKNREIDLVGISKKRHKLLVGECKLSWQGVNTAVFVKLNEDAVYLSSLLPGYEVEKYLFVADSSEEFGGAKLGSVKKPEVNGVKIVTGREMVGLL